MKPLAYVGCVRQAAVALPGDSPGADREVAHANEAGVPVFLWDDTGRHALHEFVEAYTRWAS